MKKILNTIISLGVVLMAALGTTSCLYGIGHDEEIGGGANTDGLKVNVSTTVIYADGADMATFSATFNGEPLGDGDVTFYNAETDEPMNLLDMSFSTGTKGTTQIYLKYIDSNGKVHTSETFSIQAILEFDFSPIDEEGLSVTLSTNLLQLGNGSTLFIVRYNGVVVGADEVSKIKCYDASNDSQITLTTTEVTAEDGTLYLLPTFTPSEVGERSFWFSYKTKNTLDKPVKIRTVDTPIPAPSADTDPTNTSFKHRALLQQFTGTWCGQCPHMIRSIEMLYADEAYADKAVHVAIHDSDSFAVQDIKLSSLLGVANFPTAKVNFDYTIENYGVEANVASLKAAINTALSGRAKAGIAARSILKDNTLLIRASVKAAVEGEYFVGAWLLESGLYERQSNASGLSGDFDHHENVVRIADSRSSNRNFKGHSLGIINAGSCADYLFAMELDESWKKENCHIVLFVSTIQHNSQVVTNVAKTTSLTSGLAFEYE